MVGHAPWQPDSVADQRKEKADEMSRPYVVRPKQI